LLKRETLRELIVSLLLVGCVCLVTWLVYISGGTNSPATHLYYIPLVVSGFLLGDVGAIIISLLAAMLAGMYMPAQILEDQVVPQNIAEVILRTLFFFVIAVGSSRVGGRLKRQAYEFRTLYEVANTINSSLRLQTVLDMIARSAAQVMDAKGCAIRLLDETSDGLEIVATFGLSQEYLTKGPVKVSESPIDRQVLQGTPIAFRDVSRELGFQYPEAAAKEGIVSVLCVPLRSKDSTIGVIRIYSATRRQFSSDEVALLTAFANQASVAIENAELYEDIRRNYYETVRALCMAIDAKDPATLGHSERVTELTERVARVMGIPEDELELLRFGTILHDVGKIGVEHSGAQRSRAEEMFEQMHPLIGRSILEPIEFLAPVLSVVMYHHEHWDGSGYPEGLVGEAIPLLARIVAVTNAYDNLVSAHGDRQPANPRVAYGKILAGAGTQFDPAVVEAFKEVFREEARRAASGHAESEAPEASAILNGGGTG
jgi:putative nucleotidyltransferase with HDIG domain